MAYMQWNHELEMGIPVIDNQHKRIVEYINVLADADQTGDNQTTMQALNGLLDYTATHFQFEEELQEKAGYPFFKAHNKVHAVFIRRISTFRERAANGENITAELLAMLKVWLSNHIKGDDRDYAEIVIEFTHTMEKESTGWINTSLKRLFG